MLALAPVYPMLSQGQASVAPPKHLSLSPPLVVNLEKLDATLPSYEHMYTSA